MVVETKVNAKRVYYNFRGSLPPVTLEEQPVELVALPPAGDRVAVWGRRQQLTIWQPGGSGARAIKASERIFDAFDMRFTRSGARVVIGGTAGERFLTIWDATTGRPSTAPFAPKQPESGRVMALDFSRDESRLAVSTNNGVTALIDPQGRITASVPQFQQAVLQGEVSAMQGLTPYLRWGSWPLIGLCLALLLWARLASRLGKAF